MGTPGEKTPRGDLMTPGLYYPDDHEVEAHNEQACNEAREKAGLRPFKFDGDECDCEEDCPILFTTCPFGKKERVIGRFGPCTIAGQYSGTTMTGIIELIEVSKESYAMVLKGEDGRNATIITPIDLKECERTWVDEVMWDRFDHLWKVVAGNTGRI